MNQVDSLPYTSPEKRAARQWTTDYADVNRPLRGMSEHTPKSRCMVQHLDNALSHSQVPSELTLHRGLSSGEPGYDDGQAAHFNRLASLKPGDTVHDAGYTATSSDPQTARDMAADLGGHRLHIQIRIPEGHPVLRIGAASGASDFQKEHLLPRGQKFRVVSTRQEPRQMFNMSTMRMEHFTDHHHEWEALPHSTSAEPVTKAVGKTYNWCNRCNKASHWTGEGCPLCGAIHEQGDALVSPRRCKRGHIFDAHGSDEGDPNQCPICGAMGSPLSKAVLILVRKAVDKHDNQTTAMDFDAPSAHPDVFPPWQVRSADFVKHGMGTETEHKRLVFDAVRKDKPVPLAVLRDHASGNLENVRRTRLLAKNNWGNKVAVGDTVHVNKRPVKVTEITPHDVVGHAEGKPVHFLSHAIFRTMTGKSPLLPKHAEELDRQMQGVPAYAPPVSKALLILVSKGVMTKQFLNDVTAHAAPNYVTPQMFRDGLATARAQTNPAPSPAQKEAGNYSKGRIALHGLTIAIENPKGSYRRGVDPTGKAWSVKMQNDYGYVTGVAGMGRPKTKSDTGRVNPLVGRDGDKVDVFIGPHPHAELAYIVDAVDKDGKWDEHKCIIGSVSENEARRIYLANYQKGWRCGQITPFTMGQFKDWLKNGDKSKPVAPVTKSVSIPSGTILVLVKGMDKNDKSTVGMDFDAPPASTAMAPRRAAFAAKPPKVTAIAAPPVSPHANHVFHDMRDGNGNRLSLLKAPYDGTEDGARAVAEHLHSQAEQIAENRAAMRGTGNYADDYSRTESRTGSTDEAGQAKWAISPNLRHVAKIGTGDARYIFGDLTAAPGKMKNVTPK